MPSFSLQEQSVPSVTNLRLLDFHFDDNTISDEETLKGVLAMFRDLQIVHTLNIDHLVGSHICMIVLKYTL